MDPPLAPAKPSPTTILSLPPELLLEIISHLPLAARTALKVSNRTLYARTPALALDKAPRSSLTPCARLAIAAHLAFDARCTRCPLCKHWYPRELFRAAPNPSTDTAADAEAGPHAAAGTDAHADADSARRLLRRRCDSFGGPGAVAGPPGACGWHRGQVVRVVQARWGDAAARNAAEGWSSAVEQMCYHCGAVRGWRACACDCETCGVRSVRTYTRVGRAQGELGRFVFFVRDGELWVREWRGGVALRSDGGRWSGADGSVDSVGRQFVDVKVQYVD